MADIFNRIVIVLVRVLLYKILQVLSGPPQSDFPHEPCAQLVCNLMEY